MSTGPSRLPSALEPILPNPADSKPQKLGLELEMFGFDADTLAPLGTPGAKLSSHDLLERILQDIPSAHIKVDKPTGVIVGLELACGNFSIEPGGQLEYASCPQENLNGLLSDMAMGLSLLEEAAKGEVVFLDHGTNPLAGSDLPLLVPKERYRILDRYFASQPGGRGVHMMRYSATAQPNIDVNGREAWEDAINLTFILTPFARCLFANSRYFQGQLLGKGSERQRIWAAVDPSRTGVPRAVAFAENLPQAYVDWARQCFVFLAGDLPIEEQPRYAELTFQAWEEQGYKGTRPTPLDWQTHLGTLFPDLRIRRFLEVRMVDAQSYEQAIAPVAFWSVALQNPRCRERLWALLSTLALEAGLNSTRDLLDLPGDHPLFSSLAALGSLLECVKSSAEDDLARRALELYQSWLERRDGFDYPASAFDYVRAQATAQPSRKLQSLLRV